MKIVAKPSLVPGYPSTESLALQYPRKELAQILSSYNRHIGNDALALEQAERLAHDNSICVCTGQQLGFLGGPIYTILKGISCIHYARARNAIPIFWLATEDHDIGEIDHTYLIDGLGNLKKYHLTFPKGRFVEDLVLTDHHIEEINSFFEQLDIPVPISFSAGASYAESMARLLAYLFRGTGLLFIEPRFLRPLATAFIEKELRYAHTILEKVRPAFDFTEGTNIFYKTDDGRRSKVYQDASGYRAGDQFFQLDHVHRFPERFSTNVAARPVLQSLLFPTAAYVAGPNEIQYYSKLAELHHFHGVPMPTLLPRVQATFIPKQIATYLEKCELQPWSSLSSDSQRELLLSKGVPTDALHRIHNTLQPKNKPQERVLSWWQFHHQSLISTILNQSRDEAQHLYIYL